MERTTGQALRTNARSSLVVWGAQQGLKFLQVPIILAYLHKEGNLVIVLAFTVMQYFTLHNFGLTSAFVKYTAECHRKKDYDRLTGLLSTGVVVGGVLSAMVLVGAVLLAEPLVGRFNIDAEYRSQAQFAVICIGVVSFFSMVFGVYRAILTGLQRIDLVNNCRFVFSLLEFVLVIVFLKMGYGIRCVVTIYSVTMIAPFLVMAFFVKGRLPEVRVNPLLCRRNALREILSVGGRMQCLGFSSLLVSSLDTLVLTPYQGMTFTGAYAVARRLAERVQMLPLQGCGALIPASADLHSGEDQTKLRAVFAMAMRITAVVCAYLFAFLCVNGGYFLRGYVGDEYDPLMTRALQFLCIALFFHTLTGPGTAMLRGAAKPLLEMVYQGAAVLLFLGLFWVTKTNDLDEYIVLTFPAGLALASIGFLVLANRYFGLPLFCPLNSVVFPCAMAPFLAWVVQHLWLGLPIELAASRWTDLLAFGCMGVVYSVLFGLAAWFGPGLTRLDKEQLVKFVPHGPRIARLLRLGEF